jgi:2-oxoglutarate ferredoxin oxidoreductase subunit alpha
MSIVQPDIKENIEKIKQQVNNFCITVATVNGSGSQTSNSTIMRAILKMGVPVSGKNLFPSNIQGLPTWFTIRVSKEGYMARCANVDIMVAMNPESFEKDLESLHPGGVFYYADHIKLPINRNDVIAYPMPVQKLSRESNATPNLRDYIANMVYVGVLAQMLGIDLDKIRQALDFHFKGKQKPVDLNYSVVEAGAKWAAENLVKIDPYSIEPLDATQDYIMMDGNTAAALGALYGGVQFAGWYPITPASSLAESLMEYAPKLRKDPETGKNTIAIVQAEDELAAIGMTVGAGWGGLRAMTSTSGPGLSLMAEYAGLAYFAEVPIVVWDIQRVGPSTGLPTRTAQADLTFVNFLSHGDTQFVIMLPGSVSECFEFGWKAFDLAEQLQTPVFVLSDLDFGMNNWMTKPFDYPDQTMERGKVLWESDLERLNGQWSRYMDQDDDGIPYRTLPGNRHPRSAYFTRGTGHDEKANYSEDPEVWERMLKRLRKKFETARLLVPAPVIETTDGARFGIISFGSCDPAVREARDILAKQGVSSDYLRVRALPFTREVIEFIHRHETTYVVELNRDGQMYQLLNLEVPDCTARLISLAHLDGLPLSAEWVEESISTHENIAKEA